LNHVTCLQSRRWLQEVPPQYYTAYKPEDTYYVGSCHHGMARPTVAGGGYGLQIWRIAANVLNKQSRTADKWWSSTRVYRKFSGLAIWSENCKWYSSLPLGAVVSLFRESV
jgi:hypothetical protein